MKLLILFLVVLAVVVSIEARPKKILTKQSNKQEMAFGEVSKPRGRSIHGHPGEHHKKHHRGRGRSIHNDDDDYKPHHKHHHHKGHHKGHHHYDEPEGEQAQGKTQKAAISLKDAQVLIDQKDGQTQSLSGGSSRLRGAKGESQKQKQSQTIDIDV